MRKVPVYKEENGVFVKVKEITEKEARDYIAGEPDVEEIIGIYIIRDEEKSLGEEERRIYEFRAP